MRGIVADSFDGRTLHRGFDRELLEERAAAKASHQARQFYQWCQERTGRKWWTVTPDLWSGAPGRASPFSPGPWRSCRPPTADGQPGGRHVPERSEAEYQHILEILPQARMCLFDHGAHPALASNGLAAADAVRDFFS